MTEILETVDPNFESPRTPDNKNNGNSVKVARTRLFPGEPLVDFTKSADNKPSIPPDHQLLYYRH